MIGIDIAEIERFEKMQNIDLFMNKVCTDKEIRYVQTKANKYQTLAGIFCAKEAISKALKIGLSKMTFHAVEISYDENGAPEVLLSGNALQILGNASLQISITNSEKYAAAVAVIFPK